MANGEPPWNRQPWSGSASGSATASRSATRPLCCAPSASPSPTGQRMSSRWVDRIAMFLTLVGLTALLVGGVGVANAVRSYLAGKTATIATLKCLGGSGGLILRIYLIHVMAMAAIGIGLGLLIGAVAPVVLVPLLANQLPVPTRIGIYPVALAMAAAFGILTAVAFSLWPLARAREVPPSALFRDLVAPARRRPRPLHAAIVAAALLALAAPAAIAPSDHALGFWFVVAAFGTVPVV